MNEESLKIGERLREWGLEKFGSVNAFAEALKIAQSQLSNYLNGRRIPGNKMQDRLRKLGCNITWLMTGETREQLEDGLVRVATKIIEGRGGKVVKDSTMPYSIKMYPVAGKVQAGKAVLTFEYHRMEPGPPGVIVPEGYWFIVKGDSMEPRYYKGEMVFVRKDLKPENGDFAVVVWNDYVEAAVKQIFYKDGNVILRSINPAHEPILVSIQKISFIAKITHSKTK